MPKTNRGQAVTTRKKKMLRATKGFLWGRKSKFRLAKDAYRHARVHAYIDRRRKKGEFRRLWQIKINAAARQHGITYSRLIERLTRAKIGLNRKMLAQLAQEKPGIFSKLIEKVR